MGTIWWGGPSSPNDEPCFCCHPLTFVWGEPSLNWVMTTESGLHLNAINNAPDQWRSTVHFIKARAQGTIDHRTPRPPPFKNGLIQVSRGAGPVSPALRRKLLLASPIHHPAGRAAGSRYGNRGERAAVRPNVPRFCSQPIPSPSRSRWRPYPGSPGWTGTAPAARAAAQLRNAPLLAPDNVRSGGCDGTCRWQW